MEDQKGIYGLPQARILAHDIIVKRIAKHGYKLCPTNAGLWKHETRDIAFVLTDENFGIKYLGKDNGHHLITASQQYYELSIHWTGDKFCGLTIEWNYSSKSARISMPTYINKLLPTLQHTYTVKPQHSPHAHISIK